MLKSPVNKNNNLNILIIGFGAQANAWARNFRDSKVLFSIGIRKSSSNALKVSEQGFDISIIDQENSLDQYNVVILLTPDHTHLQILKSISAKLKENTLIITAHGFSYHYERLSEQFPEFDFALIAPKAIASEVRFSYETKSPLAIVVDKSAISHKSNLVFFDDILNALSTNPLFISGTFKEECFADLFSEQTILCSLIPFGAISAFNKLVEKGISSDVAYIECWHEVKLIANAMINIGPQKFFEMISPNAFLGGYEAYKKIINSDSFKKIQNELYQDIEDGNFYKKTLTSDFDAIKNEVVHSDLIQKIQEKYNELGMKLKPGHL